ncbi:phage tail terminator-like protein [Moraxella sp. ZJ142]|uniref:phage tail terminator-like protein n=1 Tax=Moraxella marmotae TaxID=3344520 RepID=UPI0035D49431
MNSQYIEQLLLTHFQSWQGFDAKRYARDNRNFTIPKDGVWGRITVLGGVNQIASVSDKPCILEQGTLIIQLFCAENVGTAEIKQRADSLARHFGTKQIQQLETLAASVIYVGFDKFYQINVSVPWRYYVA